MSFKPAHDFRTAPVVSEEALRENGASQTVSTQTLVPLTPEFLSRFSLAPGELEAYLLSQTAVVDCVVRLRQTPAGEFHLLAYVVTLESMQRAGWQAGLQSLLGSAELPCMVVPLIALPRTPTGNLDELALANLPILTPEVVQAWEEVLGAAGEAQQVAVVLQDRQEPLPAFHLSELLPPSLAGAITPTAVRPACLESAAESAALALSQGEALVAEIGSLTLPQILQRATQKCQTIRYLGVDGSEQQQSYQALLEVAERILTGLRGLGLQPQEPVIFQLDDNQDFIAAFWACILGGLIPVPLAVPPSYDPLHSAVAKLQNVWQMLGQPVILTRSELAEGCRQLPLENLRLAVLEELRECDRAPNWYPSQPEDLAILLLTSGSTGLPKAVKQTHRSLIAGSAATAQMNHFTAADISLNWFPLDHVGGLVMFHIRDLYLGCQQIHAPTALVLQQPLLWLDWIDRYRVTITWAPNFAYGLITAQLEGAKEKTWDLSCLRFILNGGEAIVAKSARRFLRSLARYGLSAAAMYPAWGMSETCSAATFNRRFSLETSTDGDAFVEVGAPIPGVTVRIVDLQDQVIREGQIGRLQVKGPTVTPGYYQNQSANQAAFSADGWFNTGDLGYLQSGCLTITGREKDVIIVNGLNYYSHEIEAAVEEIPGIEPSFTAAVAVRTAASETDQLAIFFHTLLEGEAKLSLVQAIRRQVVQTIGTNPDYLLPVSPQQIPKTAIGKIQRSQLKQQFETGVFQPIWQEIEVALASSHTLPRWFYHATWKPKAVTCLAPALPPGPYLVFLNDHPLGSLICNQLEQANQRYIRVEAGSHFTQLGSYRYCLRPDHPADYQALIAALAAEQIQIQQILHLWTYQANLAVMQDRETLDQAQALGIYSLLNLTQALAPQLATQEMQLLVVSSQTHSILAQEVPACENALVLGWLKSLRPELPQLHCRHLDLPSDHLKANGLRILQELRVRSKDPEVAYRNGLRLVPALTRAEMTQTTHSDFPLKSGGCYVITGGLGGIGSEIARYLLTQFQAKLLLVGRSPRSEVSSQPVYQSLQQLEGSVCYESVDISDAVQLQRVVQQATHQWNCSLDGVIHLAGTYQERSLLEETPQSLAAVLRPKVQGTWALHQLLQQYPDCVFIHFSSVVSFFGGALIGAYTAANCFLNSVTAYQRSQQRRSYCLSWGPWEGVGMGRFVQFHDSNQLWGYFTLAPHQGINAWLAGLTQNQAQLLIGLDERHPAVRRFVEASPLLLQDLTAYIAPATPLPDLTQYQVGDRFGTATQCRLVALDRLPLTPAGNIDRQQLLAGYTGQGKDLAASVPPRNALERQIAQLWKEVLGIPPGSIYHSFFEMGGQSLLATQLLSRLRDVFHVDLTLPAIFKASTVADMAALLIEREAIPGQVNKIANLLEMVNQLSAEQIQAMLQARKQKGGN